MRSALSHAVRCGTFGSALAHSPAGHCGQRSEQTGHGLRELRRRNACDALLGTVHRSSVMATCALSHLAAAWLLPSHLRLIGFLALRPSRVAWHPVRHGIPHGILATSRDIISHTAWYLHMASRATWYRLQHGVQAVVQRHGHLRHPPRCAPQRHPRPRSLASVACARLGARAATGLGLTEVCEASRPAESTAVWLSRVCVRVRAHVWRAGTALQVQ